MKDSAFVGAANSAPIQSKSYNPSSKTSAPEKTKSPIREVVISNEGRSPKEVGPQFIGVAAHVAGGK